MNKVQYTSMEHLYGPHFCNLIAYSHSGLTYNVDGPSLVFHTPQWHHHFTGQHSGDCRLHRNAV